MTGKYSRNGLLFKLLTRYQPARRINVRTASDLSVQVGGLSKIQSDDDGVSRKRACDLANLCEIHHLSLEVSVATRKLERRSTAATTTSLSSTLNSTAHVSRP